MATNDLTTLPWLLDRSFKAQLRLRLAHAYAVEHELIDPGDTTDDIHSLAKTHRLFTDAEFHMAERLRNNEDPMDYMDEHQSITTEDMIREPWKHFVDIGDRSVASIIDEQWRKDRQRQRKRIHSTLPILSKEGLKRVAAILQWSSVEDTAQLPYRDDSQWAKYFWHRDTHHDWFHGVREFFETTSAQGGKPAWAGLDQSGMLLLFSEADALYRISTFYKTVGSEVLDTRSYLSRRFRSARSPKGNEPIPRKALTIIRNRVLREQLLLGEQFSSALRADPANDKNAKMAHELLSRVEILAARRLFLAYWEKPAEDHQVHNDLWHFSYERIAATLAYETDPVLVIAGIALTHFIYKRYNVEHDFSRHTGFALCAITLSRLLRKLDLNSEAIHLMSQGLLVYERLERTSQVDAGVVMMLDELSLAYYNEGFVDQAVKLRKSIRSYSRQDRRFRIPGMFLEMIQNAWRQKKTIRKAVHDASKKYTNHPFLAAGCWRLAGVVSYRVGRDDQAQEYLSRSARCYLQAADKRSESPEFQKVMGLLGDEVQTITLESLLPPGAFLI